ncbi:DnaJ domain [Dillenia turbinata]|uniref:DnaJ domain n=1 Tax=Dillenia turbinata TaxID=194707 RepID=A0AAN8WAL6_9MAGN
MDGNKDDALKCLKIGIDAFERGDRTRALKFITKARRLDPSLPVDDLLSKVEGESSDNSENPNGNSEKPNGVASDGAIPNKGSETSSNLRHRGGSSNGALSSSSSSVSYTEEQITIVRQIRKKKDYYDILGLEKNCSVEDVRKAYRKLSLKVHPDKNKAPGAEEAFKAVSKAFQCLSDEESRKKYDVVGPDEIIHERRPARRGAQGFNGFYDADIDAEEIFRNFFFGGMPPATAQFRTFNFGTGMGPRMGENGSASFNLRALIQLLPVLLILLLNFLPSSEPIYSFNSGYPYDHRFVTPKGVNYYVRSTKFEQDYPPSSHQRLSLESKIEQEYFSILRQNCRLELQRRQWGFIQETPYCDILKRFQ